jgi:hypothetical protein
VKGALTMRILGSLLFVAVACVGFAAIAEAQTVTAVQPEPAWCGGAWEPPMLKEVVKDGKKATETVPGTGGTNFGPCVPVEKEVRALDGKVSRIALPTEPSHPATLVTFQRDEKGMLKAGRVMTRTGADGKPETKWVEITPRVLPTK